MSKFKVGDKVRVRSWDNMEQEYGINGWGNIDVKCGFTPEMKHFCGKVVTIKSICASGKTYRIKEDNEAYYWSDGMFKTEPKMIVVYADVESKKVVAIDKYTDEKAEAYCHPDDGFDFKQGAVLAFERLRGRMERVEEPHGRYNGKVIFIKENPMLNGFTVGKIYKVKNGVIKNDNGGLLNFKKKFLNVGFAKVKR